MWNNRIEAWEKKGRRGYHRIGIYILVMQSWKENENKFLLDECVLTMSSGRHLKGEYKESKVSTEEVFWEWVHSKDSSFS